MTRAEKAVAAFQEGYNCAQSTVLAFMDDLGLEKELAMRLASGFGGGMGRMQEVCGAVSGAVLVLGSRHGASTPEDREAQKKIYALVQEFFRRFSARCGSCLCRELLNGIDLKTPEGQRQFKEEDLRNRVCVPSVRSAVEIAEELYFSWLREGNPPPLPNLLFLSYLCKSTAVSFFFLTQGENNFCTLGSQVYIFMSGRRPFC